ncbi:MAG: hypothetical protein H7279_02995, partial [Microbacteriaceae bacterium]|nr:hypothetical protein [Microbacteriaceae bacterium]
GQDAAVSYVDAAETALILERNGVEFPVSGTLPPPAEVPITDDELHPPTRELAIV